ncbi:MAG TPA: hypothetical protein VEH09_01710 [Thermodesulfobacteriota bacterium]|nr:hypothetical protein [Thermodesulfobacteriota bacterium]
MMRDQFVVDNGVGVLDLVSLNRLKLSHPKAPRYIIHGLVDISAREGKNFINALFWVSRRTVLVLWQWVAKSPEV